MIETAPSFLRVLATLRWFAVAGQVLAVGLALAVLHLPLDAGLLWGAIVALAAFNLWASWRARRVIDPAPAEVVAHVAVDVAELAWLISFSGGAMNPFASLFLLPIALVSLSLPLRWVGAVALLCGFAYAACAVFGHPLPHLHGAFGDSFDLHLWGMAVNFAISAIVVTYFLNHMAQALRQREQELARLREQFARNEGIVALATHAASVAHELNTPLGSMTLMLEDWLDPRSDAPPPREDLLTLSALVDACRDRVRDLAAPAQRESGVRDVGAALDAVVERWQLLRPTIEVVRSGRPQATARFDAGIGHLLQALLNNAADAGERAGRPRIDLALDCRDGELRGEVRDYGAGFDRDAALLPATLFKTTKMDGLGVGLALSHATVERLGGELAMDAAPDGGARIRFRLPLPALLP